MSRLAGKVVIVSGGTRGMGEATVRGLVREGANVVFGGRSEHAGEAIAASLGGAAIYVPQDVGVEAHWERIVGTAVDRFGKLTGLISNAGTSVFSPLEDITDDLLERAYRINQLGPLFGMKHAAPHLRRNGGGSIANVASGAYVRGHSYFAVYAATKGAIVGMSRAAAAELAKDQVRVNVVHPGFFATELLMEGTQGAGREIGARVTPMGRAAEPEEIVGTMIFLMSDESTFVTGTEIVVDGGYTSISHFDSGAGTGI